MRGFSLVEFMVAIAVGLPNLAPHKNVTFLMEAFAVFVAARPESNSEGSDKPKPESEGRSR